MTFFMAAWNNRALRLTARTLYYTAIILALLVMSSEGAFTTPTFVYQRF